MASTTGTARVGYISNGRRGAMFEAFEAGIAALGDRPGRITPEPRFAEGSLQRLDEFARELAQAHVDVIAASGAVAACAAQRATSRIPIIFAAVLSHAALVEIGLVASAERPGANITGFSSFNPDQPTQAFRLLRAMLPNLQKVAVVSDHNVPRSESNPGWNPLEWAYDQAARAQGIQPHLVRLHGPVPDFDAAFAAIGDAAAQAVVVLEMPVTLQHLERIAAVANGKGLPLMLPGGHPNFDALLNFGTTINDANRAMASYVEKVLAGADPAGLPLGSSNRLELVINLATARRIGIAVTDEISRRADRLID